LNKIVGYNLYGGSTITQQLARTLFFNTKKTFLRKYVEAIAALELDLVLRKDRILELYFNTIEWGKDLSINKLYIFKKMLYSIPHGRCKSPGEDVHQDLASSR
jgi:hypothetical protein